MEGYGSRSPWIQLHTVTARTFKLSAMVARFSRWRRRFNHSLNSARVIGVTIGLRLRVSGTGEEWADDDNGMTSADAQAFKRACSCVGLGRYFYDITPIWVDLDQNRQPVRTPVLSAWALPEN